MNETVKMLLNHTSIRKYQDRPIDKEIIDIIIRCAQMAPTSSHYQSYTIIEVRDLSKKEVLFEISGGQQWIKTAPLVLLFCADLHRGRKFYKGVDKEIFSNTECYTVAVVDASLAMQKAFIAAQSMGLGGVAVGGIRNNVEKLSQTFELPDMVAPLYLLCLGYPDDVPEIKPRLPQEEICKIDFYDQSQQERLIGEYDEVVRNYYTERTKGKITETWTERCGKMLMDKTRDDVGVFFRKIGLLKK